MKKFFSSSLWKPVSVTRSTTLSPDTLEIKKETIEIDGNLKSIWFYNALGGGAIFTHYIFTHLF